MKTKLLFFLLLLVCTVSAQEVSDSYKVVTQENDSTWLVRQYDVYEYSLVFNGLEYTFSDTVLIPDQTAYYDSAGLVRYLLVSTTNEQNEQAAILSRAFDAATTLRNVVYANTLINTITGGSSNYYEETSKLFANQLTGTYRVFYDSAGVQLTQLAEMTLVTTPAHPDGRILRLTLSDKRFFNVNPLHRWFWIIPAWPYGETQFAWHRVSGVERPIFRPRSFIDREEVYTRIVKLD